MVSPLQLQRHREFLLTLHRTRTTVRVKRLLEQATDQQLRTLVSIIRAVVVNEIPVKNSRALGRLRKVKPYLRKITTAASRLLRATKPELLKYLLPLLSIIKLILLPLFDPKPHTPIPSLAALRPGRYIEEEVDDNEEEEEEDREGRKQEEVGQERGGELGTTVCQDV